MRRGTDQKFTFTLTSASGNDFSDVRFTIEQDLGKKVIECTKPALPVGGGRYSATFSQAETLQFVPDKECRLQAKAKNALGLVVASEIVTVRVKDILDEEEM